MVKLNTRHFAVMGASVIGTANVIVQGSIEVTIAAVGVLSAAFIWDKIQNK